MRLKGDILVAILFLYSASFADDLLYRYEGDVLPYDESAGWIIANPCESPCSESLESGHFILHWDRPADPVNYHLTIEDSTLSPILWVEWRFSSNRAIGPNFFTCDAAFSIHYNVIAEIVFMYGDMAISFSGDDFITGLEVDELHTYRFEIIDENYFNVSVDGVVFIQGFSNSSPFYFLQMWGGGSCENFNNTINEWDFVRYGTISTGEKVITSDPPGGFLNANQFPSLDRFTVIYDQPNYAYIDDIAVEVSGGDIPNIIQTHRLDNGDPEVLEIVLDKPIPLNQATRFIFNDGETTNIVSYSYILGDSDADGKHTLRDFAAFQNCFKQSSKSNNCSAFDFDVNDLIDLSDYNELQPLLSGQ